jgi:hypothetical protein
MINPFEVLQIEETKIVTKHDCVVTLKYDDYDDDILETKNSYKIPGSLEIFFPDLNDFTQIITPYAELNIIKSSDYEDDDSEIIIKYNKDDIIISQEYSEMGGGFGFVKKIVEGKLTYIKTPEGLLNIFQITLPQIDLCHLEVLISNMLKDEDDNLCRISGNFKNFKQVGVMNQAKNDSWLSAIAFQNIEHGINKALVKKENAKMNPLEKIMNEDFSF